VHVALHRYRRRQGWSLPLPHEGHIAFRVSRVKSTPDDRLDIVEAGDPTDSPEDARLEDQRALGVPAALDDPNPEVCQRLQKPIGPAAVGEIIQRQVAGSNPEVEPLPFGVFSNTNPAIKVGAIILMDGVAIDGQWRRQSWQSLGGHHTWHLLGRCGHFLTLARGRISQMGREGMTTPGPHQRVLR
jgi:hypothetical protein